VITCLDLEPKCLLANFQVADPTAFKEMKHVPMPYWPFEEDCLASISPKIAARKK
jgi:hypothetical protein